MDSRRDRDGADADRLLHSRLMAGDPIAPLDLADAYVTDLLSWAKRTFPHVDPHVVETCAIDAVLELAEHPERYDPARLNLAAYLRMATRGDILNAMASEQRRQRHLDPVEVSERVRNIPDEHSDDPSAVASQSDAISQQLNNLLQSTFDETERRIVQLMIDGERRTVVYASVLGLRDLPDTERARAVKQVKDRLQKRLQRLAPRVTRDA